MAAFSVAAWLLALAITLIEYTEVVVLVYALGSEEGTLRHGAAGAAAGTAVVAAVAVTAGGILARIPSDALLGASAIVLAGFGVFLFRSTLKTYRRVRSPPPSTPMRPPAHFAGGFAVGAIETTEAAIVLVPLAAGGQATAALAGALVAAAALAVAVALVHERVRRIKTPGLKLGATGLLFAFAVYWAGEAAGIAWPGGDLTLIPLFVAGVLLVRVALEAFLRTGPSAAPAAPPGR
ncbi:MAG: hypothetical protein QXG65_05750 [Thermoplasmata archaeon]